MCTLTALNVMLCVVMHSFNDLTQKRLVEQKSLNNSSSESNHGETSVNNFLLHADLLLIIAQLGHQTSVKTDIPGSTISIVLVEVHGFKDTNEKENLEVSGETNRGDGAERISVGELSTGKVQSSFLDDHTDNSEHADTSVLDLSPTSVVQVGLDIGKTHGVESHVTRHRSIELVRLDQERDGLGHFLGIQGSDSTGRLLFAKQEERTSEVRKL